MGAYRENIYPSHETGGEGAKDHEACLSSRLTYQPRAGRDRALGQSSRQNSFFSKLGGSSQLRGKVACNRKESMWIQGESQWDVPFVGSKRSKPYVERGGGQKIAMSKGP